LGSTHCKDSRDIKFAKFGQAEHFLWILQVAAYLEENLNLFDFGLATWLFLIGGGVPVRPDRVSEP
jgi:hypothetical protein